MPLKETDFDQGDSLFALAQFYLRNVETISLGSMPRADKKDIYLYNLKRSRDCLDRLIAVIEHM